MEGSKKFVLGDSESSMSDVDHSEDSSLSEYSDNERKMFIVEARKLLDEQLELQAQAIQKPTHINGYGQNNGVGSDSSSELNSKDENENEIELITNNPNQELTYDGKEYSQIPSYLQGISDFSKIIKQNFQQILQSLSQSDKEKLYQLMPSQVKDKEKLLIQFLRGDKIGFLNTSPLEQFDVKLESNNFTQTHKKYKECKQKLLALQKKENLKKDIEYLERLIRQQQQNEECGVDKILNHLFNVKEQNQQKRDQSDENMYLSSSESLDEDYISEEEKNMFNDIHAEFDDLTSGYSTISSNKAGELGLKRPMVNTNAMNQLKYAQFLKTIQENQEQQNLKQEQEQPTGQSNTNQSGQKGSTKKGTTLSSKIEGTGKKGSAKKNQQQPVALNNADFGIDSIINSERFKSLKVHKNQVTLKKSSQNWIEIYRRQEEERYKHPTRPWVYYNEDGTTSIVGPVIKKKAGQTNQKPREHPQLHSNRPAIVTLLCLARDAASRLPDGVGTRADILELIKQSQWIKLEGTDPAGLNNIVSGALDRLHYEDDACVKYDSEKKLWIYLHKNRPVDWTDWQPLTRSELPNSLENNSLNPFAGTEREFMWKDTLHKERNLPPKQVFDETENSESIESSSVTNTNQNAGSSKIVLKIFMDKGEIQSSTIGSKRNYGGMYRGGQGNGDFEEQEVIKPKRSKH